MIKTVSFAPPRSSSRAAASSKASAKSAPKAPAPHAASGSSSESTSKTRATVSASQARQTLKQAAQTAAKAPVKARTAKVETAAPVEVAPVKIRKTKVEVAQIAPVEAAPKAKRSRVPKDLAQQYGARADEAPHRVAVEAPAPRKRRTKEQREARSQLLRPDEEVLQRLQQAQTVAPTRPAPRRARGWRFECGHCGRVSRFETPGALCACGAIAVRE